MATESEDGLLIDRLGEKLDAVRLLRGKDVSEVLESFGGQGRVEHQMIEQLSPLDPIAHPERFEEAHRRVIRALEIYDRNAARKPSSLTTVPKPIRPVAVVAVRYLVRLIVRKYQRKVSVRLRQMYAMREASAAVGSREHLALARARRQMDEILGGLNKNPLPLPAFIGVGALVSTGTSTLQNSLVDEWGRIAVLIAFFVLGLGAFWCIAKAAGIARRRTRIALDAPLGALWQVMGDAGGIPKDQSRQFALIASVVFFSIWIVIPVLAGLVWQAL